MGACLADFAPHWRSLLGNCRATGIVEDGVGIAFQHRPQLTHQCISFRTKNSRQDLQQAVDALLFKGANRAGHQRDIPRVLQPAVPGPKEDRRSADSDRSLHPQPPHGSSTLQDGDARVRPFMFRCLPSCSDAPQVSMLRGQQASLPVHLPPFWVSDITPGVHQAAAARHSTVKAARCEATRLLRRLADQSRYSGTGQTARPDDHQGTPVSWMDHQLREVRPHPMSGLPVHRDAVQHSTTHCYGVAPLPKMHLKVQAVHQHWMTNPNITARDLHWPLGMLVFMASLVQQGRLRLCPVQ